MMPKKTLIVHCSKEGPVASEEVYDLYRRKGFPTGNYRSNNDVLRV
jgi:hypothetical protein